MKKQLNELIEIANGYVVFSVEAGLPKTHNLIRGKTSAFKWSKNGTDINVYLADSGETWSVRFDKVEVTGYSKKISVPFDVTIKYLNELILDVRTHLYDYLLPNVAKCKLDVLKDKHKEIKRLERELRKLKGLVTTH